MKRRRKLSRKEFLDTLETVMREEAVGKSAGERTALPDTPEFAVVRRLLDADFSGGNGTATGKPTGAECGRRADRSTKPPVPSFAIGLLAAGLALAIVGRAVFGYLPEENPGTKISAVPVISVSGNRADFVLRTGAMEPAETGRAGDIRFEMPGYIPDGTHLAGIVTPSPGTAVFLFSGDHPFVLSAVGSRSGFPAIGRVDLRSVSPEAVGKLTPADGETMKFSRILTSGGMSYRIAAPSLTEREMEKILESLAKEERP